MTVESTDARPRWRRSTRCEGGQCLEVAVLGNRVAVRDSADPNGAILTFPAAQWAGFLHAIRAGDLDG
jgi:Domain of unknown function (DUF397)